MNTYQRYVNLLLASRLGPVVRLFGVIEGKDGNLRCECRKWRKCKTPGKHPIGVGWLRLGTTDSRVLWSWLTLFPNNNHGILTGTATVGLPSGETIVVLDYDNRPNETKNELAAEHICLREEIAEGIDRSHTVVTNTGSGNGSKHGFYRVPVGTKLSSRIPGVQIKAEGGMVVAPGSKHLSSQYYTFEGIHLKDVQEMPHALLGLFTPPAKPKKTASPFEQSNELHERRERVERQLVSNEVESLQRPPEQARKAGTLRPDLAVLKMLRKDPKAGPRYFDTVRSCFKPDGKLDTSADDFALCCKLAWYTNHNWPQYVRLFRASALCGPQLTEQYISITLRSAFKRQVARMDDKIGPKREPGRSGRPVSETTKAVLDLRSNEPELRPIEIARRLNLVPTNVYNILSRNRKAA
jgi:hypothetical protein